MTGEDEDNFEKLDDIFYGNIIKLWEFNVISECYKKGYSREKTLEYLHNVQNFTLDIYQAYNEKESGVKTVITK